MLAKYMLSIFATSLFSLSAQALSDPVYAGVYVNSGTTSSPGAWVAGTNPCLQGNSVTINLGGGNDYCGTEFDIRGREDNLEFEGCPSAGAPPTELYQNGEYVATCVPNSDYFSCSVESDGVGFRAVALCG